jgi:hypothetical protein
MTDSASTQDIPAIDYATALADMLLVHPRTVRAGDYGCEGEHWFTIDGCYDHFLVASYDQAKAKWGPLKEEDGDERSLTRDFLVCYDTDLDLGVWRTGPGKTREEAAVRAAWGGWDSLTAGLHRPDRDSYKRAILDPAKVERGMSCLDKFHDFDRRAGELRDRGNPLLVKEVYPGQYRRGELELLKRDNPDY